MSAARFVESRGNTAETLSHTEIEVVSVGKESNLSLRDASNRSDSCMSSAMPSILPDNCAISSRSNQATLHPETVFKIEPGSEALALVSPSSEPAHFDNDSCSGLRRDHPAFVGEEPLEIQCGENTAVLYVSKLCQGSKGPCILFNNEWLTPNELQYISGRETAKDWKRSIRYKGKSLKSLIARGLIKVHPPICDCLGCRISSPVNRGRLASKCGVTPPSPRNRKREVSKSLSCWSHEDLDGTTPHRHYSTSDIDGYSRHPASNGSGFKEVRESSSSATSECSDVHDDNPFSPVVKRPRSNSPDLGFEGRPKPTQKRRSSDSSVGFLHAQRGDAGHYERASMHRINHVNDESNGNGEENQDESKELTPHRSSDETRTNTKTRSAFRTVHQDGVTSMTLTDATAEGIQREMAARAAKLKQKPQSPGGPPAQFLPPFTQFTTGPGMVSPTHTSPRLDPLLFANPHGSNLYHHAFRGAAYHGVPQLPRNLVQYRLLSPPGTGTSPQSTLAGLSLQNHLLMQDLAVMATSGGKAHPYEKKPIHLPDENGVSRKRRRSSNDHSDNDRNSASVFSDDEGGSPKKDAEHPSNERTNFVSVIHKSPVNSPLTIDSSDIKSAKPNDHKIKPHKLIPKLRLNLDDNIVHWDVDQVCEFISSLTGSPEVVSEFKEQCIDGQSLILLKEEHLLNRLGIKLGPALKILAHIRKILDKVSADDHTDSSDSG